jgi:pectin methylesterase-like acyl-CoA thioesterase
MRIIPKQLYIFLFFFLLVHTQIQAQLNGTYSVGPSVTDSFRSISEAVDSLISQGVSGPVIIKMQAATYTEQIRIPEISGTSPFNTITFQPASSAVIIKYDSTTANNNYVFSLDSADHIILKNLTFLSAGNAFGSIIQMQGGAHHNVIYGCRFEGTPVISSSTDHALIYSGSGTDTANIIDSNIFNYGAVAVFIGGGGTHESYNVISRNICRDQYSIAIHVNTQKEPLITQNNISSNSSVNQFYGIDLQACNGHARVLENKVAISNNGMGILYYDSYGSPGKEALIANNFVWVGGHTLAIGVYVNNSNTLHVFNNNINISSTSLGSAGRAVDIEPNATQDISVKNNNLVNMGQGFGLTTFSTIRVYSDYNNFYVPYGYLGYWNGYYSTSLAVWTNGTQQDSHSLNVNPTYYSHSDLHVNQFQLDSAGLPMPLISNDIDGDPRNTNYPDIGADEFDVYSIDAGVIQLESPTAACPGIPLPLSVRVRNFGTDTLRSLKIGWSVNDSLQSPLSVIDRISSLSTKVYTIGTYTFYPGISYLIKIWTYAPNDSQDHYTPNDTFVIDIFKTALQGQYSIGTKNRDYSGFGQAISDMISYGICGPVTFLVDSGHYSEQISIPEIQGASSLHPITFRYTGSDPGDVVISNNNVAWYSNYTVKVSGSHIRFENMSIQANDPSLAIVIEIAGNASDIQFNSNKIRGIQTNTVSIDYALVYASAGNYLNDSIVFDSCEFLYGSYALYLTGPNVTHPEKGTRITKNTFRDQYRQCMYLYAQEKPEITDNRIYTSSNYNNYHGIDLQYCVNGFDCSRNVLSSSDAAYAVYIHRCTGSINDKGLISNNFIDAGGTQNMAVGIFISYSSYIDLYHNSIRIKNSNSNSRALFLSTDASYIEMKNNIFSNFGMGYAMFSTVSNTISSDYNNFYSKGSFLNYMMAAYNNMSSYQSGTKLDSHSYNVDPRFIDNQHWHIRSIELDSAGIPVGIMSDLDGEARSTSHPDIGADEYTLLTYDSEIAEILSFTHVQCDGWIPIEIRVRNLGVRKLDSLKISWEINDVNQGDQYVYSSLSFLEDTNFVIGVYKFDADSHYHVRVICSEPNGVQDQNPENDTLDISVLKLLKFPEIDRVYGDTICPGDSALLRVLSSAACSL